MSSAGIQKLFCGIYSAFKCSLDEFVGEKVFSPSYTSVILASPPGLFSLAGIYCFGLSWFFFGNNNRIFSSVILPEFMMFYQGSLP